jgi:hypothetical protein
VGRRACSAPSFLPAAGQPVHGAAFTGVLIKNGIAISMEGKDAGRDNIFVERLWRSIKNHIRGSLSEDFFSSLLVV